MKYPNENNDIMRIAMRVTFSFHVSCLRSTCICVLVNDGVRQVLNGFEVCICIECWSNAQLA